MNKPSISAIIIVKNGEKYLRQAIESILAQTHQPDEVILVDGNSTDNTLNIAKEYEQIIVISQTEPGIANGYNMGIEFSRGELIAFLACDDLWTLDKLSVQVNYLSEHPDIQYTAAKVKFFLEEGHIIPPGFKKELLLGSHIGLIMETLVARKTLFDSIGKLNTELNIAVDVDWFARAKDYHIPMAIIDRILLHKRIHNSNLSNNAAANNQELLKLLRHSIKRQRNC
jgi:glycosyltransferase involved in cell wall biosynthesis